MAPAPSEQNLSRTRPRQLIEVLVFLGVLALSMSLSPLARLQELNFPVVAGWVIIYDLGLLGFALFLLWRTGQVEIAIGWKRTIREREVLLGVALFVPFYLTITVLEAWLLRWGLPELQPPPYLIPRSGIDYSLAFILLLVVAVTEETIFRGYLILRFSAISGNRTVGVVLSTLIFAFGHGYQGVAGIIVVGVIGLLLACVYLWRMSLIAPMTMHFIQNFVAMVVMPLCCVAK